MNHNHDKWEAAVITTAATLAAASGGKDPARIASRALAVADAVAVACAPRREAIEAERGARRQEDNRKYEYVARDSLDRVAGQARREAKRGG